MNTYKRQLEILEPKRLHDVYGLIEYYDYQSDIIYAQVFHEFYKNFQLYLLSQQGKYQYPEPFLAFIDRKGINAFGWRGTNLSLIGINKGTVEELHKLFNGITLSTMLAESLSRYKVMTEIGKEDFVMKLYLNCQMCIFFHEMGHLVQNLDGINRFHYEMANQANYSEIHHLAEYDADQFAAILMASSTSRWMDGLKAVETDQYTKEIAEMLLAIVCAGCFIPFLIFQKNIGEFYTKAWSHPHPSIRAGYLINTIVDAFQYKNSYVFDIDRNVVLEDAFEMTKRIVKDASLRSVIFQSDDDFNKFYAIWGNYGNEIKEYFDYLNDMAQNTKGLAIHHLQG